MRGLRDQILEHAQQLGFDLTGIALLGPTETSRFFDAWIDAGYAGTMAYLANGAEKRSDTRLPFPGVSSAIVVGMNYDGTQPSGPIARYARGNDYHDVLLGKLNQLHTWIQSTVGHDVRGKAYVDTGPILERELARRAGLGWFGKNTNLIYPKLGSFFFLGSLLIDLELEPSAPFTTDHCGTCTRCLDACPTDALVEPHVLDATRCISYLTIELRGPIPAEIRPELGELIYGCDICQDVCPWNVRFSRALGEPGLAPNPHMTSTSLQALMQMSDEDWRVFSKGSPIKRTKRRGFLRNVAVALGNRQSPEDVPALVLALSDHEPLVRGHAAWALGRINTPEAQSALLARAAIEDDPWVIQEITAARHVEPPSHPRDYSGT